MVPGLNVSVPAVTVILCSGADALVVPVIVAVPLALLMVRLAANEPVERVRDWSATPAIVRVRLVLPKVPGVLDCEKFPLSVITLVPEGVTFAARPESLCCIVKLPAIVKSSARVSVMDPLYTG